ncbi:tape measure protein [Pedobacter sp. HDW13]|uniref:tape measure protein n=1 Tax=Pedobacter sp. HDW13 TaxID=2714940 RepID=UPI00140E6BF6|nr:tape measure protein [Pedobacter sp. HDW13]QIL41027.1 tape measure protein [Pedobacter sp. HDW13]
MQQRTATEANRTANEAGRLTAIQSTAALNNQRLATEANRTALSALRLQNAQNTNTNRAASGSYDEMRMRMNALGRQIRATADGFSSTNTTIRAQIAEYNRLNDALKRFDASMGNHQRNVGNYAGAMGGVLTTLSGMAAGFLSIQAILSMSFDTALKTDGIKTSLEFTFGSVDAARSKMDGLRVTANRLGIEYVSLADSYRSFAGAAIASNFPLRETDRIFNAVANAGAKLKLSSDQMSGALTALQQMISKGNVQSEELRGQLGERLPGAFAIAAKAMGVTQQELGKLLQDGKVLAADLLPKLADELDKTFSNDKNEKVDSLQGSVNRLKNSFSEMVETKGALSAFFAFVVDAAGGALQGLNKLSQSLGVFYDLATHPKKFIGDSGKAAWDKALQDISERAESSAKKVSQSSKGILVSSLNDAIAAQKGLSDAYKAAQDKYKAGGGNFADAKAENEAKQALQYQILLVKNLRSEYDRLYGAKGKQKEVDDANLTSVKEIQKRINDLKALDGSAIIGSTIYNRIKALQDMLAKPKTGKSDEEKAAEARAKKITALYKDLELQLAKTELIQRDLISGGDIKKFDAYQEAIEKLTKLGFEPLSDAIQDLAEKQSRLVNLSLPKMITTNGLLNDPKYDKTNQFKDSPLQADTTIKSVKVGTDAFLADLERKKQAFKSFKESMAETVNSFVADVVTVFAQGVGEMMAGDMSFDDFGRTILNSFGQFLANLGKMMVQYGTTALLMGVLSSQLTNPITAIPAAIGLIAAGAALAAIGSGISSAAAGGSSKDSTGSGVSNVPHFANGGIVSGPTLAMVGEYPNAKNDPEVISPLSKLKTLIGAGGGNNPSFNIVQKVSMGELVIAIERQKKANGRV